MTPPLPKATPEVKSAWVEVYETRKQTHVGFIPPPGEEEGFDDWGYPLSKHGSYSEKEGDRVDRRMSEHFLLGSIQKLRQAMVDIGRACALDPEFAAKADANEETFDKLFADLGSILLGELTAVEGFREGVISARQG
jgi:hypothetical protein